MENSWQTHWKMLWKGVGTLHSARAFALSNCLLRDAEMIDRRRLSLYDGVRFQYEMSVTHWKLLRKDVRTLHSAHAFALSNCLLHDADIIDQRRCSLYDGFRFDYQMSLMQVHGKWQCLQNAFSAVFVHEGILMIPCFYIGRADKPWSYVQLWLWC